MRSLWKRKKLWVALAALCVVAGAAFFAYRLVSPHQDADQFKILKEGDVFPANMPLVHLDGKYTQFGDYAGKVVVINFWAGWCPPCMDEMPSLYALQARLGGKGLVVLGVSMDDVPAQGLATLTKIAGKPPFPILKGVEEEIAARFPIEGLPFTVVVDKKQKIRYAQAGERDWSSREAVKYIEGLM